jgi:hypothetical protein
VLRVYYEWAATHRVKIRLNSYYLPTRYIVRMKDETWESGTRKVDERGRQAI